MPGLLKKRTKRDAEIPTASMADIAFLLLIFFLVTTTINVDTGIGMTLPPKLEDEDPPPVRERNMLKILVNANGQVLMEDRVSSVSLIRDEVKRHVLNYGEDPNYSEDPNRAVVSLKTDRQTSYNTYIEVLDEIWMAYREMWDAEARQMGYPNYDAYRQSLDVLGEEENLIREKIKANISIAEPDAGTA